MIRTKNPIIVDIRTTKKEIVNVEVVYIEDDFKNERYQLVIADFVMREEAKEELSRKTIYLPYTQRDMLKKGIVAQLPLPQEMTESEVNKTILPFALLYYVQNDVLDAENNTLIYGSKAEDWEVTPIEKPIEVPIHKSIEVTPIE